VKLFGVTAQLNASEKDGGSGGSTNREQHRRIVREVDFDNGYMNCISKFTSEERSLSMRMPSVVFVSIMAVFGGMQLASCASQPGQRSTGQTVDDSVVTTKVKSAIAQDASVGTAMDVNVTTYRGVVQLSGFVDSQQAARRAEQIAQNVEGVRSVKNDLRVGSTRR
jgi:hypothetical protein